MLPVYVPKMAWFNPWVDNLVPPGVARLLAHHSNALLGCGEVRDLRWLRSHRGDGFRRLWVGLRLRCFS